MKISNLEGFSIKTIKRFDKSVFLGLNKLLLQWSKEKYQMPPSYFKSFIENKNNYLLCLYHKDSMIGMVTLIKLQKISGLKGAVEHLIIDEKYRGRGLGKKMMFKTISLAKELKIESLQLTSEPKRIVANKLYKKLGFKIKKTNFYIKKLK